MRAAAVVAALVVVSTLVPARTAAACSCVERDPDEALRAGDAVAVVTATGAPSSRLPLMTRRSVRVRVERALRGELPQTFPIHTRGPGASCGFELDAGRTVGVVLERRGGRWWAGLCDQLPAGRLLAAAVGLPPAEGAATPVVAVAGPFGTASLATLAADGTVVAWGGPPGGRVDALAACPGGERVAAVIAEERSANLSVWDTQQLREVRRVALAGLAGPGIRSQVACRDPRGRDLVVVAVHEGETGFQRGTVIRVADEARVVAEQERVDAAGLSARTAWFAVTTAEPEYRDRRTRLVAIDVDSGAATGVVHLGQLGVETVAPSPTADVVALAGYDGDDDVGAVLLTVVVGEGPRVAARSARRDVVHQQLLWLSDEQLVVRYPENGAGALVNTDLDVVGDLPLLPGWEAAVVGRSLYVGGADTRLRRYSTDRPGGPTVAGPLHLASVTHMVALARAAAWPEATSQGVTPDEALPAPRATRPSLHGWPVLGVEAVAAAVMVVVAATTTALAWRARRRTR